MKQRTAQLVLLKMNIDDDDGNSLAGKFGVSAIPAVVFVDGDGNEVHRFVGFIPADDFLKELDRAESQAGLDSA